MLLHVLVVFVDISIHALREESDRQAMTDLLTPSISIHALREESDARHVFRRATLRYFNPRSP